MTIQEKAKTYLYEWNLGTQRATHMMHLMSHVTGLSINDILRRLHTLANKETSHDD
jgi:hypothetical protein